MRPIIRQLAPFAAVLAVLYAVGFTAGTIIDAERGDAGHAMDGATEDAAPAADEGEHEEAAHGGDLRLVLDRTRFARGAREPLAFRIEDAEGKAVRDFDVEHERRMHLIVVRSDLTGFQHVHPRQDAGGTWTVPLTLRDAGAYRVFADFSAGGERQTLDADLQVAGAFAPRPLPHPAQVARTDGYEVRLARDGDDVRFSVLRGGRVLDDVEPYLGARGHLVALREGDLSFLHVHPKDDATAGRGIRFGVEYPSDGRFRLFLQFKHEGRVHTAAFTQEVGGDGHGH